MLDFTPFIDRFMSKLGMPYVVICRWATQKCHSYCILSVVGNMHILQYANLNCLGFFFYLYVHWISTPIRYLWIEGKESFHHALDDAEMKNNSHVQSRSTARCTKCTS